MQKVVLIFIIVLAILLRFYRINENLVFHGELGQNYLAIKDAYFAHQIPLLGPPTSHPWLSFGPLFYYIFGPFLILNKWNPNTGAYFFAVISCLFVIVNYFVIRKLFSEKMALISSFLIAISPTWLDLARQARFFSLVTYLFYPFLLMTTKTLKKTNARNFFILGLIFGAMINFHLAPIFLLPPLIIIFRKIKLNVVLFGLLGFVIPNIPFLIYNFKTHFEMITKFIVWIPYRSVIYRNFNLRFTLNEIYVFFGGLLIIPIVFTIFITRKNKIVQILSIFLFFGILALILHKDPPEHYFYVLYSIPVILISILISKLKLFVIVAFLILVTAVNFSYLFSNKWFYVDENKVVANKNIPYKLQVIATKKIINDTNGRKYYLKRIGYSDQFDDYYEQNYDYLLWYMGNPPSKISGQTNLTYTIVEFPNMEITRSEK